MSLPATAAGWSVPRRWVVAAAATFGMLASFGMATTVSVFIKPFEDEFGWLRADISFAYALFSAGAALGGLVVGWAFDRIDTRIIVVFGTIVMAAGLAALAFTSDLATVQHIYLATGVAGFACLYTPLIAVIGLWFDRGRGLAMGIVTAGGAIGQGMTPLLVQPMIAAFGWRNTCLMLGTGCAVTLVPVMLLVTKPCAHGTPVQAGPVSQPWPLPARDQYRLARTGRDVVLRQHGGAAGAPRVACSPTAASRSRSRAACCSSRCSRRRSDGSSSA
jgi:MFS family permease